MPRLLIVFLCALPLCLANSQADERPNLLLILSDDHSLPHLGVYGSENCQRYHLTPHLDAFAAEGRLYHRAYTSAPQCAPSRTAIFAGRSPIGINATRFSQPARSGTPLFTDVLRKAGYWVGLDGRHQHLDGRNKDTPAVSETLVMLGMRGEAFEARFDHFVRGTSTKGNKLENIGDWFGSVVDSVPNEKPFFLYFGFSQPHRKWGEDHEGIDPTELVLPKDWPDTPEVRLDYARYLAEVRDLDTGFGEVMEALKDRGLDKNTLVVFMGDNGEALLRGKGTLTTRGINVPLLARWPEKIEAGGQSQALISGVDLAPTLLAAAGVKPAKGMTGLSFLPDLLGEDFQGRTQVFAERGWHHGPVTRSDGFDLSRSITTDRYHFIYNAIPERAYGPVDMTKNNIAWDSIKALREAGELDPVFERLYFQLPRPLFELYDLDKDPFQLNNLAGQTGTRSIETKMRSEMDLWMIREGDYLPLPTHAAEQATQD